MGNAGLTPAPELRAAACMYSGSHQAPDWVCADGSHQPCSLQEEAFPKEKRTAGMRGGIGTAEHLAPALFRPSLKGN